MGFSLTVLGLMAGILRLVYLGLEMPILGGSPCEDLNW